MGVVTGILIGILVIVAMGATLSDNAILNAIFDSTNSAIKIINVQDTFSSNVDVGGTLAVTGTTTLTGAAAANGGFSVDSPAFTVANTSGNVSTTGTLAVTSTTTLTGALTANGGITADAGAFSVADTSGNITTTGTLTVGGTAALNNGITVDTSAFTVANTSGNVATTGTLTVASTSSLKGATVINEDSADADTRIESNDVSDAFVVDAGANFVQIGTWPVFEYVKTTDQSYSLSSSGRAANYIQTVGGEASFHLMTALLTSPGAGAVITIKTGGTNNVVIDTEGAETIDGAANYTLDASYEAVTLTNDGSNWFILGGYLE